MAIVRVSIAGNYGGDDIKYGKNGFNKRQAFCFVTVLDNRTLELDYYEDLYERYADQGQRRFFGLPGNWNEVQWGFLVDNGDERPYIVDASDYVGLSPSVSDEEGNEMLNSTVTGLQKGQATVIAYLGNNFYSKKARRSFHEYRRAFGCACPLRWDILRG